MRPAAIAHQSKECRNEKVRKYRNENIEKIALYERKRANLPHRVKARIEYSKTSRGIESSNRAKIKWSKSNKIKRLANNIVNNNVRCGNLIKPDNCSECGKFSVRIHGHHDDYAFPLTVRWLCPQCHRDWHRVNGEGKNAS